MAINTADSSGITAETRPGEVPPSLPGHTTAGRAARVLLVEDEPAVRTMTETVLQRLGYNVITADTPGSAFLLAAQNNDIEVLITDVTLPGLSGRTLAGLFAKMFPNLKTLFVSGDPDKLPPDLTDNTRAGSIQKPFTLDQLSTRLTQLLTPAS
jgi:two-component system cell cycle sensor histidine kinase/response regulator CckA